jgi:hypothetical protein
MSNERIARALTRIEHATVDINNLRERLPERFTAERLDDYIAKVRHELRAIDMQLEKAATEIGSPYGLPNMSCGREP